jgi:hypothetical protein
MAIQCTQAKTAVELKWSQRQRNRSAKEMRHHGQWHHASTLSDKRRTEPRYNENSYRIECDEQREYGHNAPDKLTH